jgi:hypothetical protein
MKLSDMTPGEAQFVAVSEILSLEEAAIVCRMHPKQFTKIIRNYCPPIVVDGKPRFWRKDVLAALKLKTMDVSPI